MLRAPINSIQNLTDKYSKFISFLVIGVLTACVYFILFTICWKWLGMNYKIAVTSAYIPAVSFQFLTNRSFAFKNRTDNITYQAIKFIMLLAINYVLTITIVTGAVIYLSVSPYLGMLLSLGVTMITGFLISKLWVFKRSQKITLQN